jgi:hypothetical protein
MSPGDFGTRRAGRGTGTMIITFRATALAVAAFLVIVYPVTAAASSENVTGEDLISPFWGGAISQWTRQILYWANEREIDPDLVASVIRNESVGHAEAEGPQGAVGLMMVLPAEASGMSWRPSADELKHPNVNLRWGTGVLKQIIRDAGGDLYLALAAYNGGWEQVHLPSTQRYAHKILTYYAYAIAAHHGYSYQESKEWTMVLMLRSDGRIKSFQTHTSDHDLVPCFGGALQFRKLFPDMVNAPRTQVAHFVDEEGHDILVDAWLFVGDRRNAVAEIQVSAVPPILPLTGHRP